MKIEELHIGQRVKFSHSQLPEGVKSKSGKVIGLRRDGSVDLISDCLVGVENDAGQQIVITADEIESEIPTQEYKVSMLVKGRVDVFVEASSFKEAFELARKEEYDPAEVDVAEYAPIEATRIDDEGITEYKSNGKEQ